MVGRCVEVPKTVSQDWIQQRSVEICEYGELTISQVRVSGANLKGRGKRSWMFLFFTAADLKVMLLM